MGGGGRNSPGAHQISLPFPPSACSASVVEGCQGALGLSLGIHGGASLVLIKGDGMSDKNASASSPGPWKGPCARSAAIQLARCYANALSTASSPCAPARELGKGMCFGARWNRFCQQQGLALPRAHRRLTGDGHLHSAGFLSALPRLSVQAKQAIREPAWQGHGLPGAHIHRTSGFLGRTAKFPPWLV